jgi:hypothetical protein
MTSQDKFDSSSFTKACMGKKEGASGHSGISTVKTRTPSAGITPRGATRILPSTIPSFPPPPYILPMQALIGLNPDSLTNLFVLQVF